MKTAGKTTTKSLHVPLCTFLSSVILAVLMCIEFDRHRLSISVCEGNGCFLRGTRLVPQVLVDSACETVRRYDPFSEKSPCSGILWKWSDVDREFCCAIRAATKHCEHVIVFEATNGLGNRLRGFRSIVEAANMETTSACIIPLWPVDAHCPTAFEELFDSRAYVFGESVADRVLSGGGLLSRARGIGDVHQLLLTTSAPLFIRTSTSEYYEELMGRENRAQIAVDIFRMLQPRKEVIDYAQRILRQFPAMGVHARTLHPAAESERGIDMATVPDAELNVLNSKRNSANVTLLISNIRTHGPSDRSLRVFVAVDNPPVIKDLVSGGMNVIASPVPCHGRSQECVVYALAEMIALSHVEVFMGSKFSSFSEVVCAQRIALGMDVDGCVML
jgi:hypothetical protein